MYLLLGALAYWPVVPGISGRVFGLDGDFTQSVWFISWVPHALAHGLNPFFSAAMYAPVGVNLAQNTASPFLGLLTAPLAPVLSPVAIGNLLLVLAMPLSATAAFVVLERWDVWGPAAALGGLIYGFSPYMVGQGLGHPELMFLPLPPLIAMTIVTIGRGGASPWQGVWLGLLLTAQFLISPEVLVVVLVLAVLGVGYVALRHLRSVPAMVRAMAVPMVLCIGVAVVLLAYPAWMLVAGPQHFAGPTVPLSNPYYNDALSFVVHGTMQRVSLGMPVSWSGTLSTFQPTEAGGYIGIPVLVVTGFLAWRSRRSPRMQLAVALLVTSGLLSLGPYLYVQGRSTGLPMPFFVLAHLPLLNNVLPSRISFEMDACLAAVIAFGIDDLHRAPVPRGAGAARRGRWAGPAAAGAVLAVTAVALVATQLPVWPYETAATAGLPSRIRQVIPPGDPVAVTYPYTNYPYLQPMIWQTNSGFAFRTLGGYARHSNAHGNGAGSSPVPMDPPGLQQFLLRQQFLADPLVNPFVSASSFPAPTGSDLVATTRTTLVKYHVRLVIVDRSMRESGPVVRLFETILGPPRITTAQYSVWVERRPLAEHG